MDIDLFFIVIVVALLDWVAIIVGWQIIDYIAKPSVIVLLILWFSIAVNTSSSMLIFIIGLSFSLLGDVFLMLPGEYFIAGLSSFLLTHLAYILVFNKDFTSINLAGGMILFWIFLLSLSIYRLLSLCLNHRETRRILITLRIYLFVISMMLFSATTTLVRAEWQDLPSILIACGALLLYISDLILAWNKFLQSLLNGKLLTRITYHSGQILLVLGVALQFH